MDGIAVLKKDIIKTAGIIQGINAEDLLKKEFPEPRWAVPGLLPEGCLVLAGKPKKGKSIMALNLGLAISLGGYALGKIPVSQGDVVYLALEDNERRLQKRLKQMMRDVQKGTPSSLHLYTKWPKMDAGGLELLEDEIKGKPNTRFVIIDTFQKFRSQQKGNGYTYAQDYDDMGLIKEVADRCNVCIIVIHHLRKSEADDIFDTVSGSLGITGSADGTLIMENVRGNTTLYLQGRDIEETEYAISLDGPSLSWMLLGDRAEIQSTQDRQAVYDVLKDSATGLGPGDISAITGKDLKYINKTLASFLQEGKVKRVGRGVYILDRK